jgi:DNA-binding response OmpR family regulator
MNKYEILIIEPLEDLAKVLARAFNQSGISSAIATTAQEGIRLADKKTPKMVIMELIISNHNGLEFIHEFRSYPEWLRVPIIIYSHLAPSELDLSEKIKQEMGIAGHFYKPTTSLSELVTAVESEFAPVDI